MILLIDNYDSFSYNLYQLIGAIQPDIRVVRNDKITIEEIRSEKPKAVCLSPGPGRPQNAGICIEAVQKLSGEIPILGICLGHQAIFEAFGGKVSYALNLMHGKSSRIRVDTDSKIFAGLGGETKEIQAARYHSLIAVKSSLPECLKITAESKEGEIMALEHKEYPVYGLQFHPESILTPDGEKIIRNFIEAVKAKS